MRRRENHTPANDKQMSPQSMIDQYYPGGEDSSDHLPRQAQGTKKNRFYKSGICVSFS